METDGQEHCGITVNNVQRRKQKTPKTSSSLVYAATRHSGDMFRLDSRHQAISNSVDTWPKLLLLLRETPGQGAAIQIQDSKLGDDHLQNFRILEVSICFYVFFWSFLLHEA